MISELSIHLTENVELILTFYQVLNFLNASMIFQKTSSLFAGMSYPLFIPIFMIFTLVYFLFHMICTRIT